ncbi:MAG: hypothetical protein KDH15_12715 [Rhodocyclaceae bacterium]|nr:hypothetical protein [Rhodocyclaceae bacterium]
MKTDTSVFGVARSAMAAELRLLGIKCLARLLVAALVALHLMQKVGAGETVTTIAWAWVLYSAILAMPLPPGPLLLRTLPWLDAGWAALLFHASGWMPALLPALFLPLVVAASHTEPDDTLSIALPLATGAVGLPLLGYAHWPAWQGLGLAALLLLTSMALPRLVRRQEQGLMDDPVADEHPLEPDGGAAPLAGRLIELLRKGFSANVVMLAVRMPDGRSRVFVSEDADSADELADEAETIGGTLYRLPANSVTSLRNGRVKPMPVFGATSPPSPGTAARNAVESLAEFVDCRQLLCLADGEEEGLRVVIGRAYRPFDLREAKWLASAAQQMAERLGTACLLEYLSAEVASMERQRLSRDLHDSAIQPYIGLKFAIEALARKLDAGDPLADDVERLLAMMQGELDSLRGRMQKLRASEGASVLAPQVKRQVKRLSQLYGLEVSLDLDEEVRADHEMCGEVLHLVSESLSNVRRHTASTRAAILMRGEDEWLRIEVRDEGRPDGAREGSFEPRSLTERAAALGGYTSVRQENGGATVAIRIPLTEQMEKA